MGFLGVHVHALGDAASVGHPSVFGRGHQDYLT